MHNKVYSNCSTIFAHNLGSFDGYFIYKALMSHFECDDVSMVVDDQNKFVCLQILKDGEIIITFKDSYRIFPVSLNKLCQSFNVEGKVSDYNSDYSNIHKLFNDISLLKQFKEYALQDTVALYNALRKAQVEYFEKFQVDISTIYSTSTLSLKVFRNRFLTEDIAILSSKDDDFVRRGYLGGATDYYQEYAENVHYYDVNSLYPFAMKMVLPNKPIARYNDMTNIPLDDFFGFALAEVTCPEDIKIPLLPYKDTVTNRTIHPVGKWTGVYYSEELKAAVKLGYEIKLIEGIRFSKFNPFNEYIDHFYNLKKNSDKNSGTYFISKMQLNQLYGIFGRRKTLLKTINTESIGTFSDQFIKTIIDGSDKWSTLLIKENNSKIVTNPIQEFEDSLFDAQESNRIIKSNVGIAAAVTANARIIMHPYKLNAGDSLCYTDTDSIFTTKPLDNDLIGKELGLMKDELNGAVIDEAYFFGIKKYGYRIGDQVTTVFAGIKRNSLTWGNILKIHIKQI